MSFGIYKDKHGNNRVCNNSFHTHYYEQTNIAENVFLVINFIMIAILSIIPPLAILYIIVVCCSEKHEKKETKRPFKPKRFIKDPSSKYLTIKDIRNMRKYK